MAEQVFYNSDEAAKRVKVTGWVSRHGRFFGDNEQAARYDGCTHKQCDCGKAYVRSRTMCEACGMRERLARFEAMPYIEWDGSTPLCLFDDDQYFFSEEGILEYCEDRGLTPESLRFVVCEPEYARELDADDMFVDILPEDMTIEDVAPELADAFAKLNDTIKAYKKPLCWFPGKQRTRVAINREAA